MIWLGRISDYQESLKLQNHYVRKVLEDKSSCGYFLALEHEPVITLGLRGGESDILKKKMFPVVSVPRGGRATLHHRGQLVVYPILPFQRMGLKPKQFVELIAQSLVELCNKKGVPYVRFSKSRPGVYTDKGKIAFLGFRFQKGISSHGFSLNVFNNLSDFSYLKPCGEESLALDRLANYPGFLSCVESRESALKDLAFEWEASWRRCYRQFFLKTPLDPLSKQRHKILVEEQLGHSSVGRALP